MFDGESGIFEVGQVQLQWQPHYGQLVHASVRNNWMLLLCHGHVLRIDLDRPAHIHHIPLHSAPAPAPAPTTTTPTTTGSNSYSSSNTSNRRVWQDASGHHAIIGTTGNEYYYLHTAMRKPRPLSKLKGKNITAIAFPPPRDAPLALHTGPVLLGTAKGLIYEIELTATPDDDSSSTSSMFRSTSKDEPRLCRQLYALDGQPSITGLFWDILSLTASTEHASSDLACFMLITTHARIYQLLGPVSKSVLIDTSSSARMNESPFHKLFEKYTLNPPYQELPLPHDDTTTTTTTASSEWGDLKVIRQQEEFHSATAEDELIDDDARVLGPVKSFGWMTAPGIYYGDFSIDDSQLYADSPAIIENAQLLPYPATLATATDTQVSRVRVEAPLGMMMTAFHVILVYADRVKALCRLNDELVWDQSISSALSTNVALPAPSSLQQPVSAASTTTTTAMMTLGPCKPVVDDIRQTYWLYSPSGHLFEIAISPRAEQQTIWRHFLSLKQYQQALDYAPGPVEKDRVMTEQAREYFKSGRWLLSAMWFGRSAVPVEEVALMFLGGASPAVLDHDGASTGDGDEVKKSKREALKTYVQTKLRGLGPNDATQRTLLTTWLLDLYLKQLADSSTTPTGTTTTTTIITSTSTTATHEKDASDESTALRTRFHEWLQLTDTQRALDRRVAYDLFQSHGLMHDLVYYADLVGDYDRVVAYYAQRSEWRDVLGVLVRQARAESFYKYSPGVMEWACKSMGSGSGDGASSVGGDRELARDMVDAWIRMGSKLSAAQLLPAILKYQAGFGSHESMAMMGKNQAVRYLEHCVYNLGCEDVGIHNLLLSLYIKSSSAASSSGDGSSSMASKETESSGTVEQSEMDERLLKFIKHEPRLFDLRYALRLCLDYKRLYACIVIYGSLGMFEQAVELALKYGDLELAMIYADKPTDDSVLRKRLWCLVLEYLIQSGEIKKAMGLLDRTDGLVKIEDVLPMLPENVKIETFKQELCDALEDYQVQVDQLKREMDDATRASDLIRKDLRQLRQRSVAVSAGTKCGMCKVLVMAGDFYVFGCGHVVHAGCAADYYARHHWSAQVRRRVFELIHLDLGDVGGIDELDGLVGSDCALCGEVMVRSIDRGFIHLDQDAELIHAWSLT